MTAYLQKISSLNSRALTVFAFLLALPVVALAADQAVRSIENEFRTSTFAISLVAVQVLWFMGYCASSLPMWAGWKDQDSKQRLMVVAGMFASACLGNIVYYGGLYGADLKPINCFIGAILGGFAGEKGLTMLVDRYTAKVEPS